MRIHVSHLHTLASLLEQAIEAAKRGGLGPRNISSLQVELEYARARIKQQEA